MICAHFLISIPSKILANFQENLIFRIGEQLLNFSMYPSIIQWQDVLVPHYANSSKNLWFFINTKIRIKITHFGIIWKGVWGMQAIYEVLKLKDATDKMDILADRTRNIFLAPGTDGSRFLPVLGNSTLNLWSRAFCIPTHGGPLYYSYSDPLLKTC